MASSLSIQFSNSVAVFTSPVEIGFRTAVLLRSAQPLERGGDALLDHDWPLRWAIGRRPSPRGARGSNSRLRWPPTRTVPRYAVPMPKTAFALSATLIEIFFGWCSGFFGIRRVSTPSFKSALTCSLSTPSGSVKARVKFPNVRS